MINGIGWVQRLGSLGADLPVRSGPYPTADDRCCRWRDDGTGARLQPAVIAVADADADNRADCYRATLDLAETLDRLPSHPRPHTLDP